MARKVSAAVDDQLPNASAQTPQYDQSGWPEAEQPTDPEPLACSLRRLWTGHLLIIEDRRQQTSAAR